jgi:DNA-binding MarR family transcriptional regulator/N-acetylglutamate synthase-like GNAT family acetyltransferase
MMIDLVNYPADPIGMTVLQDDQARIAAVRRFNRFYTRQIGVLRKTFLDSPYSLGEARILYEISRSHLPTASEIARTLGLDTGYLSRVLHNFERRGLIERRSSRKDARQSHLALSVRGKKSFAPVESRSQQSAGSMLAKLPPEEQARLIAAMDTIETLLDGRPAAEPDKQQNYFLRGPRPGDFGWIVKRHAELYAQEYRWVEPFEGVCAQIVADFINKYDASHERCWIVEMDGENVGTVMLVKDSADVARLRLLLVDPKARGLGLGARLTDEAIRFARGAGYRKMTLWTHSILGAARHIYQKAGFRLRGSEPHQSWGQPVVSEYYDLQL